MIYGKNNAAAQEAKKLVQSIIEEPECGKIYHGTVKRIVDFGAFIEILPGKEGLCHISKLSHDRVKNVSDVLEVGQEVDVKLIEIDRMGRLNLSYIDAQPGNENADGGEEKKEERKRDYNRDRRDNRDYRGPRRDRDFHKEGRNEKKENKDAE